MYLVLGLWSRNISTGINNKFTKIFPRGNFGEKFLRIFMKFRKNRLSSFKIGIETLNSEPKMLKLCH